MKGVGDEGDVERGGSGKVKEDEKCDVEKREVKMVFVRC